VRGEEVRRRAGRRRRRVVVQVHGELEAGWGRQPPRGQRSHGGRGHLLLVAESVRDDLTGALDVLAELLHVAFQLGAPVLEPGDHLKHNDRFNVMKYWEFWRTKRFLGTLSFSPTRWFWCCQKHPDLSQ